MKKPFLEKSTLKWLLVWIATFWIFFLGVFAAEISFKDLKIVDPERVLTQSKWNDLIDGVTGFIAGVNSDYQKYAIPVWTVIIYSWEPWEAWNPCPKWWTQWYWWWADKLLMPLQPGEWTTARSWGSGQIQITMQNMPKHSHYVLNGSYSTESVNANNSLSVTNVNTTNDWDKDYTLLWSSAPANVGKTSEEWLGEPITFIPAHQKVLFCIKEA